MKIEATKRLRSVVTAAPQKWVVSNPRKMGLDSIRVLALATPLDQEVYLAFDGEVLEAGYIDEDGTPEAVMFDIRKGQEVDLKKINSFLKEADKTIPPVTADHVSYLLAGIKF